MSAAAGFHEQPSTGAVARAWDRFWFRPTPLFWLGLTRVVMVGFALYMMYDLRFLVRLRDTVELPAPAFDPLPLYEVLTFGGARLGQTTVVVLFWATVLAGATALVGLFTRISLLAFAVLFTVLQTYLYSFDEFHHPETIVVIALGALALSPAGRALSVDAWRRFGPHGFADAARRRSPLAGWPLKLIWVFFSLAYFSAGLTKLLNSTDWLNGWTLQFHVGRDGFLHDEAAADWIASHHGAALLLSYGAVAFELLFWTTLLRPKLLRLFVPAGAALHIGILLIQHAPFLSFVAGYVALLPFLVSGTHEPAPAPGGRAGSTRARADDDLSRPPADASERVSPA